MHSNKSKAATRAATKPKRNSAKAIKVAVAGDNMLDMETDDTESFQQQALQIRALGDDFDPSIEPQNGEEFLMKMLYERKKCPSVVVKRPKDLKKKTAATATNGKYQIPQREEPLHSNSLRPTNEWKSIQVTDFLATRAKIQHFRQQLTVENYSSEHEPPLTNDAMEWQRFCRQQQPLLSLILRINQRQLEQLLEFLCDWLRAGAEPKLPEDVDDAEEAPSLLDEEKQVVNEKQHHQKEEEEEVVASSSAAAAAAQTAATPPPFDLSSSQHWLGAWLYATMACLHQPLEPNVHSTLREVARMCIKLRSRLLEQELEKAVPYNLFIYLIAKAFDQLDFAEYV